MITLIVLVPVSLAQNLILNGSFEMNSATETMFNMSNGTFNSVVADATAFGDAEEIDLMLGAPYGLPPVDGKWKLGIHRQSVGGATDAFAFHLSSPLVAGEVYHLDFYAHAETSFDPDVGPVEIGLSSSATSFGTLLFSTGALSTTSWTHFTHSFMAPSSASFVTVQVGDTETWAHIDNFTLVPEPASMLACGIGLAILAARRRVKA